MTEPLKSRRAVPSGAKVFREMSDLRWLRRLRLSFAVLLLAGFGAKAFRLGRSAGPVDPAEWLYIASVLALAIVWLAEWFVERRRGGGRIVLEVRADGLCCHQPRDTTPPFLAFDDLTAIAWRSGGSVCFETKSGRRFVIDAPLLSQPDREELDRLLSERLAFYRPEAATHA